jgi:pimeloyl-ACP methyl ester carboxylesterase
MVGNLARWRAAGAPRSDTVMRTFGHGVLGKEPFEQLPEPRKEQMRENLSSMRAQLLGEGFPPLSDDDVSSIKAPVLLLTGERSPPVFIRLTDRLEELLPTVSRADIPDASHVMHEENASAVNEAIAGFLTQYRPG